MSGGPLASSGLLAVLLSFVGGFVDTFGFVALFGLFTAHVTGNFVLIGAEIVHPGAGVVAKLLALPVFMVVVAIVCLVVRARAGGPQRTAVLLFVLQFVLLALFLAAGLAAAPFADADALDAIGTGLVGVAAMAVQNAAARLMLPSLVPTTVMTGNVTQFVIDAVDALRPAAAREDRAAARMRLARFVPPMLSFAVSAILGAVAFVQAGYWGLVLPLAALAAAIAITRRAPG